MIPNELKCLGLKDMADEQIMALLKVIGHALTLADDCGEETFDEVFEDANELVLLLGGGGITLGVRAKIKP